MDTEYKAGRTPNPDVLCNSFIKFGAWLDRAKKEGFDFIATGHYADKKNKESTFVPMRIGTTADKQGIKNKPDNERRDMGFGLWVGKDTNKDQTYFLHRLNQDQLSHTLFPLGPYTKTQVRAMAKKYHIPTAEKEESMGICFIGEMPMKDFLKSRIKQKPGKVVLLDGTVVGKHDGLAYYTIGQRHLGLNSKTPNTPPSPPTDGYGRASKIQKITNYQLPITKPFYVLSKNKKTNTITIGPEDGLYKKEINLEDVHWIAGRPPVFPLQCEVRLRHRQPLQRARIKEQRANETTLLFGKTQRAPTPGQFAVFYKDGVCLGGGIIK
jgi:tRNA-specific 2-thiouridylase